MKGLICMYGLGHDPEVPAGYQDADIEMLEMREAAREADEQHQEGVRMEKETITFDDQELTTLLELVETAFAQEMFDEGLENDARPTTAMVSLKSLELKLIRIRRGVNANTQGT